MKTVSIIEVTCREAQRPGPKGVGLFGARFTMQGGFCEEAFPKHDIVIVTPSAAEQDISHIRLASGV